MPSSKSGAAVWIYSLQSDVYSPLPFLNERLTITLSLTAANYCELNEGAMTCLACTCAFVCVCVSVEHSPHRFLRAPVCDLTCHMAFLPKYTFTFLLSTEKWSEGNDERGEGWRDEKAIKGEMRGDSEVGEEERSRRSSTSRKTEKREGRDEEN